MWGRTGDADKPQVKLKVHTIRQLKKYAKEPRCLRCGYDLRGQLMANRGACPECGQACRCEDLADQIAGQSENVAPVLPVVLRRAGYVLYGIPFSLMFCMMIFGVNFTLSVTSIQITPSPNDDWHIQLMLGVSGLIWLTGLIWHLVTIYKIFGLNRGCRLWLLSYVSVVLSFR
jgi:predicted RNA-binding Zn-ribbon protein involved in translation (DUF1610 family)